MRGITRRAEKEALRAQYRASKNRFKVKTDKTLTKGIGPRGDMTLVITGKGKRTWVRGSVG